MEAMSISGSGCCTHLWKKEAWSGMKNEFREAYISANCYNISMAAQITLSQCLAYLDLPVHFTKSPESRYNYKAMCIQPQSNYKSLVIVR